ncbi:hypothetical protein [Paractinoplanes durhamensis]|uniref:Uncharacterized protein n=1 Tax=Paractinoplanes durhamensis TaxID=113563 RepID=A0ABQ3YSC4_9ACTN|nr:hypothetical protein [Actinoplanes durhamensis]GIE00481.1 hypothetical protein Adu01nite_18310 [Actinoplanes durhamensis]
MTSTLHQKSTDPGDPPSRWHRWSGVATVLGTVIGGLSLVIAVLAWLIPRQSNPSPAPGPTQVTAKPVATGTTPTSGPTVAEAGVFLDADGFLPPEAGGDRLVEVPRQIRGKDGYASHPLAIRCPSNQTGDQSSDVTFLVRGRYVQFDATVRPYYPAGADQQSVTHVTLLTDTRERDNTLTTTEVTTQTRATPTAPKALSAAIDRAEKLTLRVRCEDPAGTIVLTDSRVTR